MRQLLTVACIDKWVKSKFEDATPPELCSGPKLAIWYKNQPPGPEKTPGHGEKSKLAILPLFGHAKVLGEKTILEYNNSYWTVFNLYDISTPPDICQTPLDMIQTHSRLPRHHPDTPRYRCFRIWEGTGGKGNIWANITYIWICANRFGINTSPHTLRSLSDTPRHNPDTPRHRRF